MLDRLLDLLVELVDVFRFWEVIDHWERGIVLTLGEFRGRELDPGIHWLAPFRVQQVYKTNVLPLTEQLPPQSVTTRDGQAFVLSPVITWRVSRVRVFLLEVENGRSAIRDCVQGVVGEGANELTSAELLAPEAMLKMLPQIRARARRYGVVIENAQFADRVRARSLRLLGLRDDNTPQGE